MIFGVIQVARYCFVVESETKTQTPGDLLRFASTSDLKSERETNEFADDFLINREMIVMDRMVFAVNP